MANVEPPPASTAPSTEARAQRAAEFPLTVRDAAIGACATSAIVHGWLVPSHFGDERFIAAAFAAATVALAAAAFALTRPELRAAPPAAALLFASLLVAYPAVTLAAADHLDPLGVATKAVEAVGLVAAVRARRQPRSFGSAAVIVGAVVAMLLLSLDHSH